MNSPAQLPPIYENHAADTALAQKALALVKPMLDRARRNRKKSDERARRRYNQWAMIQDERYYIGRANVRMPAVRRGVERLVTQAIRETFPTDEWWDLRATAVEFEPNVEGQKALMTVQLQRRMRVKRKARPALRQLMIYGSSPIKWFWRHETRKVPKLVPGPEGVATAQIDEQIVYDDPDIKVVDYFAWGVYPETVADPQDARLVYEDMVVDLDTLKADPTNYANLDNLRASAGAGATGSDALQQRQQRLRRLGITEDELTDSNVVFLTECYVDMDLEDDLGLGPTLVTLAWESTVVRLQRNVYEEPPYLDMKDAEMPDEFLAHARTEATEDLQIVLQDMVNQDLDASAFANNPIVAIDPNYCEDYQAIALYPGAKIPVPPDAIKFDRPPEAAYSQKEKIAFIGSLISENLGNPVASSPSPAASGQPRGARTFGGMQMLQSLAGSEVKELVEFQEDAVWEPLLAKVAWLNAKFLSDERTLQAAGKKGAPLVINRQTFVGDYAYEWLGTSTVQNQTLRSAQMLVFLNVLRGQQAGPGWRVNIPRVLREWWRMQGLKGSDEIVIEDARQQPIEPDLEHQLVMVGRAIEVSPADNDAEHIAAHSRFRMTTPPEGPEHQKLLQHEQAHYHSFLMKQQAAMLAQQQGPMPGAMPVPTNGRPAPGAMPNGARAGLKPPMTAASGMGPARAMADLAPAGAM